MGPKILSLGSAGPRFDDELCCPVPKYQNMRTGLLAVLLSLSATVATSLRISRTYKKPNPLQMVENIGQHMTFNAKSVIIKEVINLYFYLSKFSDI